MMRMRAPVCVRVPAANFFLMLYAYIAYYFASRMSRLIILLGPVAAALGGIALGAAWDYFLAAPIGGMVFAASDDESADEKSAKAKEKGAKDKAGKGKAGAKAAPSFGKQKGKKRKGLLEELTEVRCRWRRLNPRRPDGCPNAPPDERPSASRWVLQSASMGRGPVRAHARPSARPWAAQCAPMGGPVRAHAPPSARPCAPQCAPMGGPVRARELDQNLGLTAGLPPVPWSRRLNRSSR